MKFNMLLLFIKLLCHNCYYEKIGSNDPVKLEDLPFDIPDNWMWVRLKNISSLIGGYAFKSEKFCKEGIRVIRISDFDEKGIKNKDIKRYPYSIDLDSYRILPEDILLCMTGGTVGKSFHIKTLDEYCYINQRVALIRIQNINTDYFYSVLTSSYISNVINTSKTSTNDNISMKLIEDFLVPLPPLNEQLNIIEKIKSCEPLINRYDELEKKLTSLELEFPEKFKKSILQYAIEGKLVKQDPNDEPASVLLERIKTEKEKLIKEGKIKQDKNESYIYQGDDKNYYEKIGNNVKQIEVPFNSNRVSKWIRLSDISKKIIDGNHNPPKGKFYKTDFLMLSSQNINNDAIVELDKCRYLTKEQFDVENKRTNISNNDILFTSVGTIGRTCVYNGVLNICFQRSVSIISTLINPYYLKIYLDSPKFQKKVLEEATGTAQKGFYLNQLSRSLVLVYSFEYQNRIVNRVNKLLNIVK